MTNWLEDEYRSQRERLFQLAWLILRDEMLDEPTRLDDGFGSTSIDELLFTVGDEEREIIELHLRLNLTFQEISDLMNKPLSTVTSRYRRAIMRLRKESEVRDG